MMKKLLLLAAMTVALASVLSADWPIPPCYFEGTCRADVR